MLSSATKLTSSNQLIKLLRIHCDKYFCNKSANFPIKTSSRGYNVLPSHRNLNKISNKCNFLARDYSNSSQPTEEESNVAEFEKASDDTLHSLTEYFDELVESATHLKDADVSYGDGVLTVKFGGEYGTYVINRQTPNKQIWLSSPTSGPKRYDLINGTWIYKHENKTIYQLLDDEIPKIIKQSTSFNRFDLSKSSFK